MHKLYIALTILLTVYGQIILKWHMSRLGPMPTEFGPALIYLGRQLLNPWVISSFGSAFMASLTWMAAMTKYELSFAYPFMSLAFVLVALASYAFLGEAVGWQRIVGALIIIFGVFVSTR
jgi:drug/metabolite transporter (DMT)-like permease